MALWQYLLATSVFYGILLLLWWDGDSLLSLAGVSFSALWLTLLLFFFNTVYSHPIFNAVLIMGGIFVIYLACERRKI